LGSAGCGGGDQSQSGDPSAERIAAAVVTPDQFAQLRWLDGDWRGQGVDQPPFYERYRFADDSTLVVETFSDSTRAQVSGSSRIELRDSRVLGRGENSSSYVLTEVDAEHALFAPHEGVTNSFEWRRGASPDTWAATIIWTADTGARRERVYQMDRIR
jgi:hypothetical protein